MDSVLNKNYALNTLDIETLSTQWPQLIYKRLQTIGAPVKFLEPLPFGYGFILIDLRTQWAFKTDNDILLPELKVEFKKTVGSKMLQALPYWLNHVSTPGNQDTVEAQAEPSPVDNNNFGVAFEAKSVKNQIRYNEYYQYREVIDLQLLYDTHNALPTDQYIDIVLVGYYVPDTTLGVWGNK